MKTSYLNRLYLDLKPHSNNVPLSMVTYVDWKQVNLNSFTFEVWEPHFYLSCSDLTLGCSRLEIIYNTIIMYLIRFPDQLSMD